MMENLILISGINGRISLPRNLVAQVFFRKLNFFQKKVPMKKICEHNSFKDILDQTSAI